MSTQKLANDSRLAILAGAGIVPEIIANRHPSAPIVRMGAGGEPIGKLGDILKVLHEKNISNLCLIGKLKRPSLLSLWPSPATVALLVRYGFNFSGGDDTLLKRLRFVLEQEGFNIIGAHKLCPELLADEGEYTNIYHENTINYKDLLNLAIKYGQADRGQSIVVYDGVQIDQEDKTGTDALIARTTTRGAVLVKAAKPQQDLDLDMPTIGLATVQNAIKAGFAGIIIEAHKTLFPERAAAVALANQHNLFIVGLRA